jgi:hypothetical protein
MSHGPARGPELPWPVFLDIFQQTLELAGLGRGAGFGVAINPELVRPGLDKLEPLSD